MKVLFILKTGTTIEWPIPEDIQLGFQFPNFTGSIRINGFFQGANMHIKYEDMAAVLYSSEEVPMPELKGTLQ